MSEPNELTAAVDSFVAGLRDAGEKVREAATAAVTPPKPAVEPPSAEKYERVAKEKGVGAALESYTGDVLLPLAVAQGNSLAKFRREQALKDTTLAGLHKRFEKAVEAEIKARGGENYVAENGIEAITHEVAMRDAAYREETINAEADRRAAKIAETRAAEAAAAATPKAPTSGPVARQEGVQVAPVAPTSGGEKPKSREDQIAQVAVSPEELAIYERRFGLKENDVKKSRFEVEEYRRNHNPQSSAVPICSLEDLGIPELDPAIQGVA